MATTTADNHSPQLIAISLIATPVLFFTFLALAGSPAHLSGYLLLAWTMSALATAGTFVFDRRFLSQFSRAERFAILAGNGAVALMVGMMGFLAFA